MKPVPEHVGGDVVLVKQQGAMRTGTNLVKFALEENFTNVRVLVNIGRWKHAPAHRPFDWGGVDWEGDGRHVDVSRVITPEELQAIHAAMDTGDLKYAISVRNVYAWLVGYLRFEHWYDEPPLRHLSDLPYDEIAGAVRQWNALYRSYLDLLSDDRSSMVFRLEDLLMSFGGTLNRSSTRWGLRRRHTRYVRPKRYLRAGIDGQSRFELLESLPFDRRRYLTDSHLNQLEGEPLAIVRATVDEQVVRAYGYEIV